VDYWSSQLWCCGNDRDKGWGRKYVSMVRSKAGISLQIEGRLEEKAGPNLTLYLCSCSHPRVPHHCPAVAASWALPSIALSHQQSPPLQWPKEHKIRELDLHILKFSPLTNKADII
jgi:hypothetical protein